MDLNWTVNWTGFSKWVLLSVFWAAVAQALIILKYSLLRCNSFNLSHLTFCTCVCKFVTASSWMNTVWIQSPFTSKSDEYDSHAAWWYEFVLSLTEIILFSWATYFCCWVHRTLNLESPLAPLFLTFCLFPIVYRSLCRQYMLLWSDYNVITDALQLKCSINNVPILYWLIPC